MFRDRVKLSDIPIDVLYNKEINLMKSMQTSGVTNQYIPIQIKIEHDLLAQNDNY